VRVWARSMRDYSKAFSRIGDALAALPVDSAALDRKAIVLRPLTSRRCDLVKGRQRRSWPPMSSWRPTGRTCALSLWKSAGRGYNPNRPYYVSTRVAAATHEIDTVVLGASLLPAIATRDLPSKATFAYAGDDPEAPVAVLCDTAHGSPAAWFFREVSKRTTRVLHRVTSADALFAFPVPDLRRLRSSIMPLFAGQKRLEKWVETRCSPVSIRRLQIPFVGSGALRMARR
jgi:hypothetical protein